MKGLIILADGFEDSEAITTIDILRRSDIEITLAALEKTNLVTAHKVKIIADVLLDDINEKEYDFLVIPGGKAVFSCLDNSSKVSDVITSFAERGQLIASICAAPSQVGKLGYLKNREYTCFPGCNNSIIGGKYSPEKSVVVDGNFITCKAMAYTKEFALSIIEYLQGEKQKNKVEKSICGAS